MENTSRMSIRQHILNNWPSQKWDGSGVNIVDGREEFKKHLKEGDFHIFTASYSYVATLDALLQQVGLANKVIYRSPMCYNITHKERDFPSIFTVICRS
jgi:hypothetical protein